MVPAGVNRWNPFAALCGLLRHAAVDALRDRLRDAEDVVRPLARLAPAPVLDTRFVPKPTPNCVVRKIPLNRKVCNAEVSFEHGSAPEVFPPSGAGSCCSVSLRRVTLEASPRALADLPSGYTAELIIRQGPGRFKRFSSCLRFARIERF